MAKNCATNMDRFYWCGGSSWFPIMKYGVREKEEESQQCLERFSNRRQWTELFIQSTSLNSPFSGRLPSRSRRFATLLPWHIKLIRWNELDSMTSKCSWSGLAEVALLHGQNYWDSIFHTCTVSSLDGNRGFRWRAMSRHFSEFRADCGTNIHARHQLLVELHKTITKADYCYCYY